jgi:hypothetical protein
MVILFAIQNGITVCPFFLEQAGELHVISLIEGEIQQVHITPPTHTHKTITYAAVTL